MENLINLGIILAYLMVGIGAITAFGFGIKKMVENTESAKKTIYTITGLLAVFIIAYLLASNSVLSSYEKYDVNATISKQVGMGLITFYVLIFGAIAAILYTELSKIFSK